MHHLLNGRSKNLSLYTMNIIDDYVIFIICYLITHESKTNFYFKSLITSTENDIVMQNNRRGSGLTPWPGG